MTIASGEVNTILFPSNQSFDKTKREYISDTIKKNNIRNVFRVFMFQQCLGYKT